MHLSIGNIKMANNSYGQYIFLLLGIKLTMLQTGDISF